MHPAVHHSLLAPRGSRLGRFLGVSLGGHVLILVAVGLYNAFVEGPRVQLDQKPIRATLVRLGKPRDEKLLPRKEQPPPPPPKKVEAPPTPTAPAPAPAKVAVPIPGVKPEPAPAPAPQKGETKGEDRRNKLFGAFDKLSKSKPDEELDGAEDGDPNGDSATAEGERYFGLLSSQVRRHYNVADTIPDNERLYLKAQVAMRLNRTGEVIETRLARASGNDLFDSAVLAAVKKASPFSPPPDHLRDTLQKSGIVLEFSP
ncbi:energy transducer TonB [Archangium violaceum]|uniref:Energy transducer TonB n=1 Tax=Archangium violaceum Cb vi76 TaxID=1406225 RepID=A0A084SZU4_9BACT|nr:energy transducer TonB [Archangium violaceum]KFA93979.1 energy transducer TonB [Archangium violaceum Cb vi76]